jgi:hypothetical protein
MTGACITLMNLLHRKDYFNNEGDAVPAHVQWSINRHSILHVPALHCKTVGRFYSTGSVFCIETFEFWCTMCLVSFFNLLGTVNKDHDSLLSCEMRGYIYIVVLERVWCCTLFLYDSIYREILGRCSWISLFFRQLKIASWICRTWKRVWQDSGCWWCAFVFREHATRVLH